MEHTFSWSAWDPSKWDHYHHAGIQVNAYRICPFHFSVEQSNWRTTIFRFFMDCTGMRK